MEKDPKLAEPVLRALLKFWPLTNSQKEVLFIGELEEVLELTQARPAWKACALTSAAQHVHKQPSDVLCAEACSQRCALPPSDLQPMSSC